MGQTPPRRYWLTGAGNGIGASLAEAILETGALLAVSSRLTKSCEALSARYPGQVLAMPGDLTSSQTVREIAEQIAQQWGSLDTVILNAGTAEFLEGQPDASAAIELLVRSNLLAASLCIEAALPLLRTGTTPHLVGIASPVTYLSPSLAGTSGGAMRDLFARARADLIPGGVDVTLVHPGFDKPTTDVNDCVATPVRWSADEAAALVLSHLNERPHELLLPTASMTALWPLPSAAESGQTDVTPYQTRDRTPIKGQP
jgi:NAD(P)-dependent dehydrogenase (short-subunit alcohol dehydrogenase family)